MGRQQNRELQERLPHRCSVNVFASLLLIKILPHIPHVFYLHHGHDDLFTGAIAIGECEESVGDMLGCVGSSVSHSHRLDALVFFLLLCHEHPGIDNKLPTVAFGNISGLITPVNKTVVVAFEQLFIVDFSCLRRYLRGIGGRWLSLARGEEWKEKNK